GPCDMERRVVRRRVGRAETDVLGDTCDQTEHDAEVELDRTGAEPDGVGNRSAVDAGHRQPVVEEHHVEAALLERASERLVEALVEETQVGRRMSPRPGVDGDVARLHEADERDLPPAHLLMPWNS